MGGITQVDDALEFMLAGASAVAVGTANLYQPDTLATLAKGLRTYCISHHLPRLQDIVGRALPQGKESMPYLAQRG
jgi:dihydroorotate dehydrogenase (NAD+) catalytic subunit